MGRVLTIAAAALFSVAALAAPPPDSATERPDTTRLAEGQTPTVLGSLTVEVISDVVRSHAVDLRSCYELGLKKKPALAGRVEVKFVVNGQGGIAEVKVLKSTLGDESVEACIVDAIKAWRFPAPKGGGIVIVNHPFVFEPAAAIVAPRELKPGLFAVESGRPVKETVSRLEKVLKKQGFKVFAVIDHAAGAKSVGQVLRPTTVIVFGNSKVGTALMSENQLAGLDLPPKLLVYEDAQGKTWVAWFDPGQVAERYEISERGFAVENMTKNLPGIVAQALTEM